MSSVYISDPEGHERGGRASSVSVCSSDPEGHERGGRAVSYTHLTLPTSVYV